MSLISLRFGECLSPSQCGVSLTLAVRSVPHPHLQALPVGVVALQLAHPAGPVLLAELGQWAQGGRDHEIDEPSLHLRHVDFAAAQKCVSKRAPMGPDGATGGSKGQARPTSVCTSTMNWRMECTASRIAPRRIAPHYCDVRQVAPDRVAAGRVWHRPAWHFSCTELRFSRTCRSWPTLPCRAHAPAPPAEGEVTKDDGRRMKGEGRRAVGSCEM